MPHVAIGQVAQAIENLQRFHAFFGVTFLSMKQVGVRVGAPTVWGSQQEDALLKQYYAPSGAPPDKPFFLPFGRPDPDTGFWRNPKYSGGSLQSARTRDNFSEALEHPSRNEWAFAPNYVATLAKLLPKATGAAATPRMLPVFDLAAWLYRDENLPSTLPEVEQKFRDEFGLTDVAEYTQLFDATPPNPAQFYAADPIDRDELILLTKGVPEGPSLAGRSEANLIEHIEIWLANEERLTLPVDFVKTFYTAAKAQRFVVLAGRPGTGKTAFVRGFANALKQFFMGSVSLIEVSVAQEFSEADVIGYEKISGGLAATQLSREMFLSGRPNDVYVVLLDEMNLSHVDHYLARLLPAFESDAPVELPGGGAIKRLPPDALLIGTINSYIEETTRLPLSGPVKRRANVLEMPNALGMIVQAGRRTEFETACQGVLQQTRDRVTRRQSEGLASTLDGFRIQGLDAALRDGSEVRGVMLMDALWAICEVCCSCSATALTFGVIQDILDYIAMSPTAAMPSLSDQIAQKIVPQMNGPAPVARQLLALVERLDAGTGTFLSAKTALDALLRTEDVGSGLVAYGY